MDINDEYEVYFTEECIREIRKIYAYIKENLYAEKSADRIMNKVEEFTSNLVYAPRIYAEIDKYKGTKKIYRRIVIYNYVLLYTIDEEKKKVYISHMYYGGSDYINKI